MKRSIIILIVVTLFLFAAKYVHEGQRCAHVHWHYKWFECDKWEDIPTNQAPAKEKGRHD